MKEGSPTQTGVPTPQEMSQKETLAAFYNMKSTWIRRGRRAVVIGAGIGFLVGEEVGDIVKEGFTINTTLSRESLVGAVLGLITGIGVGLWFEIQLERYEAEGFVRDVTTPQDIKPTSKLQN
jgi:hypothetical protein